MTTCFLQKINTLKQMHKAINIPFSHNIKSYCLLTEYFTSLQQFK